MKWLELRVAVDQEAVESVSELLAQWGYQGGVVIEPAWLPTAESDGWVGTPETVEDVPPAYVSDPSKPVTLRTYLPLDEETEETRQKIEHALWHLGQIRPIGPLQVRTLEEEDWANSWKQYYNVLRVGKRVVIVPSWLEHTPLPNDVVLHLDPGMAFGTGLHPTTRICLQQLEAMMVPNATLLDVGTGSGILAIAAAKLGAFSVLAIDNDPVAVDVARENIARNGLSENIQVELGSLGTDPCVVTEQYDMIAANIIAHVLIATAPHLAETLKPDGILVSSGIIVEREDEVALSLAAAGLQQCQRVRDGDWVGFVHRKHACP